MQMHVFIYIHQLYNLHVRLHIALYHFHATAASDTFPALITCKKIFAAWTGKYIIKMKSLAMTQTTIRSANYQVLGDDSCLPSLLATQAAGCAILAVGGNSVR